MSPSPSGAPSWTKLIFPPGNAKPYWLTEWGFSSVATSSAEDQTRARSVAELRAYFPTFSNRDAWEASSGMCGTSRIGTPSIAEES